jgi:hypothetical protein
VFLFNKRISKKSYVGYMTGLLTSFDAVALKKREFFIEFMRITG